jgi:hypothetical protein
VGEISSSKRVGYLFGQFLGEEKGLIRIRRSGRRNFSFMTISGSGQQVVRRVQLSKPVGELCYLMTGFQVGGTGSRDLAIVDVSGGHRYRWFIIEDPLSESPRERESFQLGFRRERVEWVESKGRGVEFVSLRHSFDSHRVRVLLRSAKTGDVRVKRARLDSPRGLLLPIRFQDSRLYDPGIALYAPAQAGLYMFGVGETLTRYDLPQTRCQGFQAITNVTKSGMVDAVEICPDGSYILAQRGTQSGAASDSVRSSGALPESIMELRLAETTRLQTQGEAPMPLVLPGSTGEQALDPVPGQGYSPFPTATPTFTATPTITPTPTATPSGLSIQGAAAISVGITRQLKLFKTLGGVSSELTLLFTPYVLPSITAF